MVTMKAREVMTRKVLTVGPDVPVRKFAEFLIDHRISAAPVVDAAGTPLGVVSEGDLLRRVELGTEKKKAWWLAILADPDDDARGFVKSHGLVVGDVMTRGMIGVDPETDIGTVANLMEQKRIKRVFVLEKGRVTGVITRSDIVKMFARGAEAPARHRPDSEIRADIEKEIRVQPWAPSAFVSVLVSDGTVELVGAVASDAQREGLAVLAQRVEGVRAVTDHLVVRKAGTAWAAYTV